MDMTHRDLDAGRGTETQHGHLSIAAERYGVWNQSSLSSTHTNIPSSEAKRKGNGLSATSNSGLPPSSCAAPSTGAPSIARAPYNAYQRDQWWDQNSQCDSPSPYAPAGAPTVTFGSLWTPRAADVYSSSKSDKSLASACGPGTAPQCGARAPQRTPTQSRFGDVARAPRRPTPALDMRRQNIKPRRSPQAPLAFHSARPTPASRDVALASVERAPTPVPSAAFPLALNSTRRAHLRPAKPTKVDRGRGVVMETAPADTVAPVRPHNLTARTSDKMTVSRTSLPEPPLGNNTSCIPEDHFGPKSSPSSVGSHSRSDATPATHSVSSSRRQQPGTDASFNDACVNGARTRAWDLDDPDGYLTFLRSPPGSTLPNGHNDVELRGQAGTDSAQVLDSIWTFPRSEKTHAAGCISSSSSTFEKPTGSVVGLRQSVCDQALTAETLGRAIPENTVNGNLRDSHTSLGTPHTASATSLESIHTIHSAANTVNSPASSSGVDASRTFLLASPSSWPESSSKSVIPGGSRIMTGDHVLTSDSDVCIVPTMPNAGSSDTYGNQCEFKSSNCGANLTILAALSIANRSCAPNSPTASCSSSKTSSVFRCSLPSEAPVSSHDSELSRSPSESSSPANSANASRAASQNPDSDSDPPPSSSADSSPADSILDSRAASPNTNRDSDSSPCSSADSSPANSTRVSRAASPDTNSDSDSSPRLSAALSPANSAHNSHATNPLCEDDSSAADSDSDSDSVNPHDSDSSRSSSAASSPANSADASRASSPSINRDSESPSLPSAVSPPANSTHASRATRPLYEDDSSEASSATSSRNSSASVSREASPIGVDGALRAAADIELDPNEPGVCGYCRACKIDWDDNNQKCPWYCKKCKKAHCRFELYPDNLKLPHFTVNGYLGSGAFAVVLSAYDKAYSTPVALKVSCTNMPSVLRDDVVAEYRTMEIIRNNPSRHFVQVRGRTTAGVKFNHKIMVTQRCVKDVSDLIKEHSRLPLETSLEVTRQAASALASLHALGLYHYDMKPSNLLLDEYGVRLTDFGLARTSSSGAPPSRFHGDPLYLAPELADEKSTNFIDGELVDVYALGASLVHMLTGHVHEKEGIDDMKRRLIECGVPTPVIDFVMCMLDQNPSKRWRLRQVLDSEIMRAPPREPILFRRATNPSATDCRGHCCRPMQTESNGRDSIVPLEQPLEGGTLDSAAPLEQPLEGGVVGSVAPFEQPPEGGALTSSRHDPIHSPAHAGGVSAQCDTQEAGTRPLLRVAHRPGRPQDATSGCGRSPIAPTPISLNSGSPRICRTPAFPSEMSASLNEVEVKDSSCFIANQLPELAEVSGDCTSSSSAAVLCTRSRDDREIEDVESSSFIVSPPSYVAQYVASDGCSSNSPAPIVCARTRDSCGSTPAQPIEFPNTTSKASAQGDSPPPTRPRDGTLDTVSDGHIPINSSPTLLKSDFVSCDVDRTHTFEHETSASGLDEVGEAKSSPLTVDRPPNTTQCAALGEIATNSSATGAYTLMRDFYDLSQSPAHTPELTTNTCNSNETSEIQCIVSRPPAGKHHATSSEPTPKGHSSISRTPDFQYCELVAVSRTPPSPPEVSACGLGEVEETKTSSVNATLLPGETQRAAADGHSSAQSPTGYTSTRDASAHAPAHGRTRKVSPSSRNANTNAQVSSPSIFLPPGVSWRGLSGMHSPVAAPTGGAHSSSQHSSSVALPPGATWRGCSRVRSAIPAPWSGSRSTHFNVERTPSYSADDSKLCCSENEAAGSASPCVAEAARSSSPCVAEAADSSSPGVAEAASSSSRSVPELPEQASLHAGGLRSQRSHFSSGPNSNELSIVNRNVSTGNHRGPARLPSQSSELFANRSYEPEEMKISSLSAVDQHEEPRSQGHSTGADRECCAHHTNGGTNEQRIRSVQDRTTKREREENAEMLKALKKRGWYLRDDETVCPDYDPLRRSCPRSRAGSCPYIHDDNIYSTERRHCGSYLKAKTSSKCSTSKTKCRRIHNSNSQVPSGIYNVDPKFHHP